MSSEDTKILELNQYQKSDKAPFIIYADLACILENTDGWKNNPENSSTAKVSENIPSGFSVEYRGKGCMKKFWDFLREHAMKIINFEKKKMKLLTEQQKQPYENAKICYICIKNFENKYLDDIKYHKVRDFHYTGEYRGAAHSICNLKCSVPKKIPIVFHNRSNYDYHFIIKELQKEFKKQFTRLGENI